MEKPPVIKPPIKWTGIKPLILFLLAFVGVMVFVVYFIRPKPPKESELIQNFNTNRAAFEQLRDMLLDDKQLEWISSSAIRTTLSGGHRPDDVNFPTERYEKYLTLLKQVGAYNAFRGGRQHDHPSVTVWAWGWAGHSLHIVICWLEQEPTNLVESGEGWQITFKKIDGHWYYWTDLKKL